MRRLTTLPPSCAVVVKSGNLNFLEPSGPLQACNGTAVPLPLRLSTTQHNTYTVSLVCETTRVVAVNCRWFETICRQENKTQGSTHSSNPYSYKTPRRAQFKKLSKQDTSLLLQETLSFESPLPCGHLSYEPSINLD